MDLRHLRAFVVVAEELHFGRAARRLGISQPPLSATIRELEDELGARLFERTSREVRVSTAGEALLERARDVLFRVGSLNDELDEVAAGTRGTLTLGYTTAATYSVLPTLLTGIRDSMPGVTLRLLELRSAAQVDAIRRGTVDVGLVCAPAATDGLEVEVLTRDSLVVVLPAAHRLAASASISLKQLAAEPIVAAHADQEPGWSHACSTALAAAGVVLRPAYEADTKLAVLALVAAGLGVSVLAGSTRAIARPDVVFRPLRLPGFHLEMALVRDPTRENPVVERALATFRDALHRAKRLNGSSGSRSRTRRGSG